MQLGMLAPEVGQARKQALLREQRQDIEVQAQRGVRAADAADGSAQFVENRGELNLKGAPSLGQFQTVVVAVEQRPPDRMLQRLDTPRQRGQDRKSTRMNSSH